MTDITEEIFDQIGTVWELADDLRNHIDSSVDIDYIKKQCTHLNELIVTYEQSNLNTLPGTTLWLAKEIISASNDITEGYERLHKVL